MKNYESLKYKSPPIEEILQAYPNLQGNTRHLAIKSHSERWEAFNELMDELQTSKYWAGAVSNSNSKPGRKSNIIDLSKHQNGQFIDPYAGTPWMKRTPQQQQRTADCRIIWLARQLDCKIKREPLAVGRTGAPGYWLITDNGHKQYLGNDANDVLECLTDAINMRDLGKEMAAL